MPNSVAYRGRGAAPAPERSRRRLTPAQEDYIKAVYQLGSAGDVTISRLAERLRVSPASATEMVGKLAGLGLVSHDRYHACRLTSDGVAVAAEMVRHHRLLEMYLAQKLGYGWDEVHEEAELLEHVISERMEDRIWDVLGRPETDPHGDPIPSLAGEVPDLRHRSLLEAGRGEAVTVRRVSDSDPARLRAIEALGLKLGARIELLATSEYEGPIAARVDGRRRQIPIGIARAVFVS